MMPKFVAMLSKHLTQLIKKSVENVGDFVSLAIAGEKLRMAATTVSNIAGKNRLEQQLKRYNAWLADYKGPKPSAKDLHSALSEVLGELKFFANQSPLSRDPEGAISLTRQIEEILLVASVGAQIGPMRISELNKIAKQAHNAVYKLTTSLGHEVWQYAEDYQLFFPRSALQPGLLDFWEDLAFLAPSRVELERFIRLLTHIERRKERIINAAVASFKPPKVNKKK